MKSFYMSARKSGLVRLAPLAVLAVAAVALCCFTPRTTQAQKGSSKLTKALASVSSTSLEVQNPEVLYPRPNDEIPSVAHGAFMTFGVGGPNLDSVEGTISDGATEHQGKATLKGNRWAIEFKKHDFESFTLTVKLHTRSGEDIVRVIPLQMGAEVQFASGYYTINAYNNCSNEFWCIGTYGDESTPTLAGALTTQGTANIISIADQGFVGDNMFAFSFPPVSEGIYDLYIAKLMSGAWVVQTSARGIPVSYCH